MKTSLIVFWKKEPIAVINDCSLFDGIETILDRYAKRYAMNRAALSGMWVHPICGRKLKRDAQS